MESQKDKSESYASISMKYEEDSGEKFLSFDFQMINYYRERDLMLNCKAAITGSGCQFNLKLKIRRWSSRL